MSTLKYEEWKALPLMQRPYAYDPVTETAFSKKAYKQYKKNNH